VKADKNARDKRHTNTRPAHDLADYAGNYEHPAYGTMSISVRDGALHWSWRGMFAAMVHRHYETFELPEAPDRLLPDRLAITFLTDREGNIVSLSAPLEPMSMTSCSLVPRRGTGLQVRRTVLSKPNLELLDVIAREHPETLTELGKLTGRATAERLAYDSYLTHPAGVPVWVKKDMRTFAKHGIVTSAALCFRTSCPNGRAYATRTCRIILYVYAQSPQGSDNKSGTSPRGPDYKVSVCRPRLPPKAGPLSAGSFD